MQEFLETARKIIDLQNKSISNSLNSANEDPQNNVRSLTFAEEKRSQHMWRLRARARDLVRRESSVDF